ncbi:MAG: ATP-binding protein [Bacteroidia bacterium]|nr:ATP-binding protein [Bacteroidia bacterium]
MENYIPRTATEKILSWASFFPAIALVGPRQVGKTSLVQKIQAFISKPSIYLDLENPADLAKLDQPSLFLDSYAEYTVILDEIQKVPHLFPVLRGIIDRNRKPGRFILLGSASPDLIRDSSETLAGRIAFYELTPFLWKELAGYKDMNRHWLRGGFPESFLAPTEELSQVWRRQFIQTYLERDLPQLGLSASPELSYRLWRICAHSAGSVLNMERMATSLGIHATTVKRYLDFFESAYLIRRLLPYFTNLKKRLVKAPKIYIRDTGVLHQLLGISSFFDLSGHSMIGASWESYIIEQIASILPDWAGMYYYRTHTGVEADLVITRGDQPEILIEIKYSSTPKPGKGFFIARDDLKTTRHFIISPVNLPFSLNEGVRVLGLDHLNEIFHAPQ